MSELVGSPAYILAYLCNFACRQCHEIWASQLPFIHNVHDIVSPREACFYDHINWSMAQGHQWSPLGLPQSSNSIMGAKTKLKAWIMFNTQKQSVLLSDGVSLGQKSVETKTESHQVGRKSAGVHLPLPFTLHRRRPMAHIVPHVLQSTSSHCHLHLLCKLVHFTKILDQWRSIAFNWFGLVWIKVTISNFGATLNYSIIPFSRRWMSC